MYYVFLNFKQMKRFFKILAGTLTIAAFAAVLASCKNDTEPVVQVTKLTITPSSHSFKIGDKYQLTLAVEPENAADKSVVWSSSDASIATVNTSTGEVTGVKIGTVTITATAISNGVKGISQVTVATNIVDETGVSIEHDTIELTVGEKLTLAATVAPEDATNKTITWGSTNTQIAPVNTTTGEVTARAGGSAKVFAMTNGGLTDTCVVIVTQPLLSLAFDLEEGSILVEKSTRQIRVTLNPPDATNYVPVWSSSNTAVATVSQTGEVTAVYEGETVITLTSDTIVKSVGIKVEPSLPRAKLLDVVFREDGSAYDASPNQLEVIAGPLPSTVQLNAYYGVNEAIIYTPQGLNYTDDPVYGTVDYSWYENNPDFKYYSYYNVSRLADKGETQNQYGNRISLGFYRIPWARNEAMTKAYQNAFSYEVVFMVPKRQWTSSEGANLFGNFVPSHSGFGIQLFQDWGDTGDPICWRTHFTYGSYSQGQTKIQSPAGIVEEKYYHVITTYDRHNPNEVTALYIDGLKIGGNTEWLNKYLCLPTDSDWIMNESMREREYTPETDPYTGQPYSDVYPYVLFENERALVIGGSPHTQIFPKDSRAPNGTRFVIARVYDKALTSTEVAGLYAAITK
jgi:uncharacterized protein YjdB